MCCALLPPVKTRFVFPVIVLASHDHHVLVPDQALAHFPIDVKAGASEVVAFGVSVPDVEHRSGLHNRVCGCKAVPQELPEVSIRHGVVLYLESVLGLAGVVHVIRRIGQQHVCKLSVHDLVDVALNGSVTAQNSVPAKQPNVTRLTYRLLR